MFLKTFFHDELDKLEKRNASLFVQKRRCYIFQIITTIDSDIDKLRD